MADNRHRLEKKDQARHFPNWDHGGKGDKQRTPGRLNNNTPAYQADIRMKLIAKYLGDVKAVEITGEGGEALTINVQSFKDA